MYPQHHGIQQPIASFRGATFPVEVSYEAAPIVVEDEIAVVRTCEI
jgi:hypothetical protein